MADDAFETVSTTLTITPYQGAEPGYAVVCSYNPVGADVPAGSMIQFTFDFPSAQDLKVSDLRRKADVRARQLSRHLANWLKEPA